ncbi:hypothetical protein D9M68_18300 [compost metagenome]
MSNNDYRLRLIDTKKKRFQHLRNTIWQGDARTTVFSQTAVLECHLLLGEITYLENLVDVREDLDLTFIESN